MRRAMRIAAIVIGAWCVFFSTAFAQSGELVRDFSAEVRVRADATLAVTETIVYDFGPNERHGIYRDIPIRYRTDVGARSVTITDISVADPTGAPYPFEVSRSGDDEHLQIGDPDRMVTGTHAYVVRYVVARAIGYFSDHDEVYWNATGNAWQVPIESAHAVVILPTAAGAGDVVVSCYAGFQGDTDRCTAAVAPTVTRDIQGIRAEFSADRSLVAGEGLTVAVGFPKGVVSQPTAGENALQFLKDNGVLALPLLVFGVMLGLWYRKGRDPKGRGVIVPQYEAPNGLTPLEISAVLHQTARSRDFPAEIVYLATLGYLSIARVPRAGVFQGGDYSLRKLRAEDGLGVFDVELMRSLFGSSEEVRLSDLKKKFYRHIRGITRSVSESAVSKGYYPSSPEKTISKYAVAGFLLLGLMYVLSIAHALNAAAGIAIGVSFGIILAFGMVMPKVTPKGAEAREYVAGFKEYLQIAEKDRLVFHNAPAKDPKRFEALLPYAMVLGVEKAWAKEFEGIVTQPPAWYSDPSGGAFTAIALTNGLHDFGAAAASTLASAPQSGSGAGGGGFSGGGFGGGGGGSW